MFASIGKAFAMLFDRDFRGLLFWSLVLTVLVFVGLLAGVEYALVAAPDLGARWVNWLLELAAPVALLFAIIVLGAPVAAAMGSIFLDRIAARVDAHFYPNDPRAPGTPFFTGAWANVRLVGLALLINLGLLAVDAETAGIAGVAGVFVNGWLLGREFFELASLRHLSPGQSDALRRRHPWAIYLSGLVIAVLTIVPVLDLIAPFFGAALMAHLFKHLSHLDSTA
jgi:CysZ protein